MPKTPRKKRITTEEYVDVEDEREIPVDPRILEEDDTVESALRQMGDTGSGLLLKYSMLKPGGSDFIANSPTVIPEEQLQEWYPLGGRFEVKIYVNGEYRDHRIFGIAPKPGGLAHGNGSGDSFLREQVLDLKSEIRMMRAAPQTTPVGELATALASLWGMVKPPTESGNSIIEGIKMGISLATTGKVEEDNSFGGILKDVVKEAAPALLTGLLAQRNAPPASNAQPTQQIAPQPNGEEMERQLLAQGIAWLKETLKEDPEADPGLYVDLIYAKRIKYAGFIRSLLSREFEFFTSIDPEIGQPPYYEFFKYIHDGLRLAFAESNPVVADSGGKTGDHANPTGNAKPRKASSK